MAKSNDLYKVPHIDTFRDLVDLSRTVHSGNIAFLLRDGEQNIYPVTHYQFTRDIDALGESLAKLDLCGKRIAIMGENRYEWALTYLAAECAACVVIPIDKDLQQQDILNILQVSEADCAVFSGNYRHIFLEMKKSLSRPMVLIDMDEEESYGDILSLEELMYDGHRIIKKHKPTYRSFPIGENDMSVLLFTSGTTGASKGVMLSQKNICSDIMSTLRSVKVTPEDRALSILPLHHTYECTIGFLCMIYAGGSIAYMRGLRYLTKDMKDFQPTIIVAVPLLLENIHGKIMKKISKQKNGKTKVRMARAVSGVSELFNHDAQTRKKLFHEIHDTFGGHLRLLIVGAAPISSKVMKDLIGFGLRVYLGYGLTECSPLVIGNCDSNMTCDTVGTPIPGVEAKLASSDEKGVGEIMVKGPNIMLGYFKNPKATEIVLEEDGWLHTGDLGQITKDGNFKIVGRSKNVIVTKNGKNIYPEELEFYLSQSPLIKESAVVGEKNSRSGETEVAAHIFPNLEEIKAKFGSINTEDVKKALDDVVRSINAKLPSYKSIREVIIREHEFVKTTTQKIKRGEIRKKNDK